VSSEPSSQLGSLPSSQAKVSSAASAGSLPSSQLAASWSECPGDGSVTAPRPLPREAPPADVRSVGLAAVGAMSTSLPARRVRPLALCAGLAHVRA
jgi:hypothetical protein